MKDMGQGRRMGADQSFWRLLDQHHPTHLALAGRLTGATSIEGWRDALDKVQRRHPNLSAGIVDGPDGTPQLQHVAGAAIPLRIAEGSKARWEDELARELATRFNLSGAPLARLALIHGPGEAEFIFSAHHLIGDAKSILFAIRDLLRALSGAALESLDPIQSLTEFLPPPSPTGSMDVVEKASSALQETFPNWGERLAQIDQRILPAPLTNALRSRCRREETTVHCALVAAVLAAARERSPELKDARITIISPSDMRHLLGAEDQFAPLAGGASLEIGPSRVGFWDNSRVIKAGLVPPRSLDELSDSFASLQSFMARRPRLDEALQLLSAQPGEKISVNNLGAVPFAAQFGDLTLEALWGPAILLGYKGERLVSAITVQGSLGLLHISYEPIPGLLEAAERHLVSALEA
jgi:hypothetical protein